ncbi:Mbeg1-like protein [Clostridium sp.]|uniref:Mbeg1-like protein n=1 Tax=Clostridium sp. TaxID=1506 RepID=UPI00283CFE88|nr:Mbeg1-like protein [Clostridium sp.]MDR3597257.1 DUF2974 domain-containing protein [Clostridium sp.]
MCKLTYEELILLDNLIYLQWNAKENDKIKDIVDDILNHKNFNKLMEAVGNCIIKMPKSQWLNILSQITNNKNLGNLRIRNTNDYKNGMKFACFVQENNEAIVVFRGTSTTSEWEDNGEGAYKNETEEQKEALNFINSLSYQDITVTGHSKGGNKAQYVTILSPKIKKCVSVNGQGFSNDFIEKYKGEVNNNKSKIVSINAQYDYVSCLFNSISSQTHYIKTEFQINPFDYHKAFILLDEKGALRNETNESTLANILNDFSLYIVSSLPKDMQKVIIDRVMDIIELVLCKEENKTNILKLAGEFLIMFFYENFFEYEDIFLLNYSIVEILILPLMFWNDFIYIEETKSKQRLDEVIENINRLGNEIIRKLKIIDEDQKNIINNITMALNNLTNRLKNEILQN